MKIYCLVCEKEIKKQKKTVLLSSHDDFSVDETRIPVEQEEPCKLSLFVSQKTISQRIKTVHVECFNAVCGEDFKF